MKNFFSSPANHLVGSPCSFPPDAGAGSGGASSTVSGAGAGSGGTGTAGAGAGSIGGGTPIHLTDDSLVHFGDGKPVKWGDHSKTLMPKKAYDDGMANLQKGRDYLIGEATKLEAAWKKFDEGRGKRPSQPRPDAAALAADDGGDDLEALEQMEVVDGRTVSKLVKALRKSGLGPMANLVAQMQAKLTKLEGDFQGVSKTAGRLAEQESSAEFDSFVTTTLKSVGELKGFQGVIDPANPAVVELAKDIYLSHDQNDPSLRREFGGLLKARLESIIDMVRKADAAHAEKQRTQPRRFFESNEGEATPSGSRPYQHRTGAELAAELFANR